MKREVGETFEHPTLDGKKITLRVCRQMNTLCEGCYFEESAELECRTLHVKRDRDVTGACSDPNTMFVRIEEVKANWWNRFKNRVKRRLIYVLRMYIEEDLEQ